MPNYCTFEMRVRGVKENIEIFKRYMDAYYEWSDKILTCEEDHCFFRVFDTYLSFDNEPTDASENVVATISGSCAWSVKVCFFSGTDTYYDTYLKEDKDPSTFKGISIEKASELLNLEIECYSKEAGMGFMEHYYIDQGKLITEEVYGDYREVETEGGEWIEKGGVEMNFSI